MPNPKYLKGKRFERKIRDKYIEQGWYVMLTSGSRGTSYKQKSHVDIIAINPTTYEIHFIQAKAGKLSVNAQKKIFNEGAFLGGEFMAKFLVITP